MTKKIISVIIPTYNRDALIGRAVMSVLKQTLEPAEIIIVDDGSTDNTEAVVSEFLKRSHIRIRYLVQENKGPAAARNTGIANAEGTVLAFLDSDDHWTKDKLAIQYDAVRKNRGYQVFHTEERWLRRGVHLNQKKRHQPPHGHIFRNCLELCCVGMSTVMVRKEIFDRYGLFDERFRCCEDYDYWLRLSVNEKFYLVARKLTIKEGGREDQVSYQYRVGMDRFRIRSIASVLKHFTLQEDDKARAIEVLKKKCRIYGEGCIRHGKKDDGLRILKLAESIEADLGL